MVAVNNAVFFVTVAVVVATLGDDKRDVRGEKALMLVVPADKITAPRAKEDIFMVVGGMRIFFVSLLVFVIIYLSNNFAAWSSEKIL